MQSSLVPSPITPQSRFTVPPPLLRSLQLTHHLPPFNLPSDRHPLQNYRHITEVQPILLTDRSPLPPTPRHLPRISHPRTPTQSLSSLIPIIQTTRESIQHEHFARRCLALVDRLREMADLLLRMRLELRRSLIVVLVLSMEILLIMV